MASVFEQVSQGVQKAANGAVAGARSLAEQLPGKVQGAASGLLADAKGLVSGASVGDLAGSLSSNKLVGPVAKAALGDVTVGGAVKGIASMADNFPESVSGLVSGAGSSLSDLPGQLVDGAKGLYNDVAGFVTGTSVNDLVSGVGSEIIGSVASEGGIIGTVAGALGGILGASSSNVTWGKLNRHLIANIWGCDSKGVYDLTESPVSGPITDASIEYGFNWQSAFENTGPESKAPALMAMLQTGQFATVINALQTVLPDSVNEVTGGLADEMANKARDASRALEGRTGITKLNSRQVFSGMTPIKIVLTLHLRAIRDPEREIYEQYQRLLRWSLPQQLAEDGMLSSIIRGGGNVSTAVAGAAQDGTRAGAMQALRQSGSETIKALFPSLAPRMVAFIYGGQVIKPMVVESLSNPLDGPRYRNGKFTYLPVQLTLATLTALDQSDVAKMFLSY